jgi:hypothetical protein
MDNYNRIEIEITSWSEADRFARISQIRFGIIRIFGDDETVEFSVLREVDPINMQTSAGELRFAFDNRDGKFDFENPTGIFNYIIDKQEVYARHGFTDEKVKLGKYYMAAWTSEDGKAIFRALDAISLTDIMFTDATYTSTSLMTIALAALSQSGITSYSLDNSLNDIIVTATIEEKTCRNILTWIATAACLTLYIDVDGALIIGALPSVANDYTISYLNSPKPKATLDDPLKSISVAYGTDLKVSASYAASGREITELDNPFIQTEARANAVLLWLYAYYSRRKNYQNDWRQDPRIEPGDIVKVQNDYGTPNVTVLSQQFTYSAGGLSGQTKSKGVN